MNPSFELSALAPMAFLGIGAMLALLLEVLLARRVFVADPSDPGSVALARARIGIAMALASTAALALALYAAWSMFDTGLQSAFSMGRPVLQLDPLSSFAMLLVGGGSLLCVWLSITYLPALRIDHGEYYVLLLLSTAGLFVAVAAVDTLVLFLGLELGSLPLYVLAGFDRRRLRSNEAGLKFFLLGAFSSAVLLYGLALLYGATGHTDFGGIQMGFAGGGPLAVAGLALVIAGLGFKVAAAPFHQWVPDVYEGAPSSVGAFLAVAAKIASFAVLLRFIAFALPEMGERLAILLSVLAGLTLFMGHAMAIVQSNVKRLLAYGTVGQAGTVLVGFATDTPEAWTAILLHLLVYAFATVGVYCVLVSLAARGRECETLDDFAGLSTRRPGLAAVMTLFLLSLAGLPGTAGFMGKFYLFSAAVNADQIALVLLGVAGSAVSFFYYLRVPVSMYMRERRHEPVPESSSSEIVVLAVCVVAVVYLGFFAQGDPFGLGATALDLTGRVADFLY